MSFTSSPADDLRAPPPPFMGDQLREALASLLSQVPTEKGGMEGRWPGASAQSGVIQLQSRKTLLESSRNAFCQPRRGRRGTPSDICVGRDGGEGILNWDICFQRPLGLMKEGGIFLGCWVI